MKNLLGLSDLPKNVHNIVLFITPLSNSDSSNYNDCIDGDIQPHMQRQECMSNLHVMVTHKLHNENKSTYIQGVPGGMEKTSAECSLC
jgi:hypothetical protein